MKHLATLTDKDIFEDAANPSSYDGWYERQAARAIVIGHNNEIFLLNMSNNGYHKLPGGGIDDGESIEDALDRELQEEIGCRATIIAEIGEIIEFRAKEKMKQTSYCYLARQDGEIGDTALEASEIDEGAVTVIAKDILAAQKLLEQDDPSTYEGHFIKRRDITFLKEAAKYLDSSVE